MHAITQVHTFIFDVRHTDTKSQLNTPESQLRSLAEKGWAYLLRHLGSMLHQVHVLVAGFIVHRFDLDKKFSESVGCLAFDSDSNLSHSTDVNIKKQLPV